jgi:hypothetical protein
LRTALTCDNAANVVAAVAVLLHPGSSYGSHFYAGEAAAAYNEEGSEQGLQEDDDEEELDDEELARRLQSQEMGMAGHMQGLAGLGDDAVQLSVSWLVFVGWCMVISA